MPCALNHPSSAKQSPMQVLAVGIFLAVAFIFSCSSDDPEDGGNNSYSSSDNSSSSSGDKGNDITNYRIKKIGDQTWMAENLDYEVKDSRCYDDDPVNCAKYGRLYDWTTAMALPSSCISASCTLQIDAKHRGICPVGWHIPSSDEWNVLVNYVEDSDFTAGTHLKATSCNGLDTYGFTALPGGEIYFGRFRYVDNFGSWWSSTEIGTSNVYGRSMSCDIKGVDWGISGKDELHSVRCVQD